MDEVVDQVRPEYEADEAVYQLRADYDAAPYDSHAYPQSAPGQLAAIAYLFGLDSPNVSNARVLEIGCAAGGNLIPFAALHPQARVVGVDLSHVQIDEGRRRVQALGLGNLELLPGDIARMDLAALGQFDFIICHGVYSWVPEKVREAILCAFRELLAPEGVAYISYNVYPGWKAKEIVRDAMLLFGGGEGTPEEKVRYARGTIDFLEEVAPADSVLARALADYQAVAGNAGDYYLLHEELETVNAPCYFLEMVDRARAHGLAYLAEARPQVMFVGNYGSKVAETLLRECGHTQVLVEQCLDFIVNRTFRQSLLVHAERAPQIRYQLDRSRYGRLHFAARVPPADGETRMDDSRQQYGEPGGATLFTHDPGIKAALDALNARWPWTLSRQELLDDVQARLGSAGIEATANSKARIDDLLEVLILQGQVRYRLDPVLPEPASTPHRLDEAARRMAELTRGDTEAFTFNLWHETLPLSPVDRHLLPLLDGTRDRGALAEAMLAIARQQQMPLERNGKRVSGAAELRDVLAEHIDAMPQRLAAMKLLRASDHAEDPHG
jgi:methyltransferase-like protein/SAM-dependent methyltransferase